MGARLEVCSVRTAYLAVCTEASGDQERTATEVATVRATAMAG